MNIDDWARAWGITSAAVADLKRRLCMDGSICTPHPQRPAEAASESRVQALIRLEASAAGIVTFRNNSGALPDKDGRIVRFGLANESPQMNKVIKSSDVIGIKPLLITPEHMGRTVGQFWCREAKEGGWRYHGGGREVAQKAFIDLVLAHGGDAAFATGTGTV